MIYLLCSHPTYGILRQFKSACAPSGDISDAAAKVTDSMSSNDARQKQQNLAVALQMGFLKELLTTISNEDLSDACVAAVLRISTLLMQSESIRDSFPNAVRTCALDCRSETSC